MTERERERLHYISGDGGEGGGVCVLGGGGVELVASGQPMLKLSVPRLMGSWCGGALDASGAIQLGVRGRDTHTKRERQTDRDRETERHRETETERERETETDRQRQTERNRDTERD